MRKASFVMKSVRTIFQKKIFTVFEFAMFAIAVGKVKNLNIFLINLLKNFHGIRGSAIKVNLQNKL